VTTVEWPDASHLRLGFSPVSTPGIYRLVLGPGLLAATGAALDLDLDGTPGEDPDDGWAASFRIPAATPDPDAVVESQWSGTVLVTGSVRVPAHNRLTLAAGTIVKLQGSNTSIDVLGELVVAGTVASPVVFTSINDDAGGAAPGSTGNPQPGDWCQLHLAQGAQAQIANARFRWGGGGTDTSRGGFLRVESRATATVTNCVFEHATYSGFVLWDDGTEVTVTSSVIRDCNFGVLADWDTVISLTQCTLDGNGVAIRGHGGTYNLTNCVVSHSLEAGIDSTGPPTVIALNHCDVWSPVGANYRNWPDQTGQNGNLSVDPVYRDYAAGVLAPGYGSPMIDAADGAASPDTDFYGQPRYDDPRVDNTGTPTPSGAYADLGAFEFVENAPSDIDLVVTEVAGPTAATVGDTVTMTWTVRNNGTAPAHGPWTDSLYAFRDPDLLRLPDQDPARLAFALRGVPLGTEQVGAGLVLKPGGTAQFSAQVRLAGAIPGRYAWQVVANSDGRVFEGVNLLNNGVVSAAFDLSLPLLIPDGPALPGEFSPEAPRQWYQVQDTPGADVLTQVESPVATTCLLYAAAGRMPTATDADRVSAAETGTVHGLLLPAATAGPWYLYLEARGIEAPLAYEVSAVTTAPALLDVVPRVLGNRGHVTLLLSGTGLPEAATVTLASARTEVQARRYWRLNSTEASATLSLDGLPAGDYALELAPAEGTPLACPGTLQVREASAPAVAARLLLPAAIRAGRPFTISLEVVNASNTDVVIPLLTLHGPPDVPLGLAAGRADGRGSLSFFVRSANADAGVLRPGQREQMTVYATGSLVPGPQAFSLTSRVADPADPSPEPIDWSSLEAKYRPPFATDDGEWAAVWQVFTREVGFTWTDLILRCAAGIAQEALGGEPELRLDERLRARLLQALGTGGGLTDRTAPSVVTHFLFGPATGGVEAVDIAFSEALAAGAFTPDDVLLTGPDGTPVAGITVEERSPVVHRVAFPVQITQGDYTLAVGPGIADRVGLTMEAAYRVTFTLEASNTPGRSVTGGGRTDPEQPVTVPFRVASHTPLDPVQSLSLIDLVLSRPGRPDPDLISLADPEGKTVDITAIRLSSTLIRLTLASPGTVVGDYRLDIAASAFESADEEEVQLAEDYTATITVVDTGGPAVVNTPVVSPARLVNGMRLEFSEAIDAATLTLEDIAITRPDGTVVSQSGITIEPETGDTAFVIHLPELAAEGTYTYRIGPEVTDTHGNPMVTGPEPGAPAGAFVGSFRIVPGAGIVVRGRVTDSSEALGTPLLRGPRALVQLWRQVGTRDAALDFTQDDVLVARTHAGTDGRYVFSTRLDGGPIPAPGPDAYYVVGYSEVPGLTYGIFLPVPLPIPGFPAPSLPPNADRASDRGWRKLVPAGLGADVLDELKDRLEERGLDPDDLDLWFPLVPVFGADLGATFSVTVGATGEGQVPDMVNAGLQFLSFGLFDRALQELSRFVPGALPSLSLLDATAARLAMLLPVGEADGTLLGMWDSDLTGRLPALIPNLCARSLFYRSVLGDGDTRRLVSLWTSEEDAATLAECDTEQAYAAAWGAAFAAFAFRDMPRDFLGANGQQPMLPQVIESNDFWMGFDAFGMAAPERDVYVQWDSLASSFTGVNRDGVPGDFVQGAIASILWDLLDPANDDGIQIEPPVLWNALVASWGQAPPVTEVAALYQHLSAELSGGQLRALQAVFIDHGIPVADDPYDDGEGNDTKELAADLGDLDGQKVVSGLVMADKGPASGGAAALNTTGLADWYRVRVPIAVTDSPEPFDLTVRLDFEGRYGDLDLWVEEAHDPALSGWAGTRGGDTATVTIRGLQPRPDRAYEFLLCALGHGAMVKTASGFELHGGDLVPDYSLTITAGLPSPAEDDPGGETPEDDGQTDSVGSYDPNDKVGPRGAGPQAAVRLDDTLPFVIHFENDPDEATAPAQDVTVTDRLDPRLDWSTFELGNTGFGDRAIAVPAGRQAFATSVHLADQGVVLAVEAVFDPVAGTVTWTFHSQDPLTGAPPADPFAGFLPPNRDPPEGEGWVSYTVRPRADLADGSVIAGAAARIVFDVNPPIDTNTTTHTIDSSAPVTTVCGVRKTGLGNDIRVEVTADDGPLGAGVAYTDVFVDDPRPDRAPDQRVSGTTAVLTAAWGATHDLYVRTVDGVGNAEPIPAVPTATVRIPQWALRLGVSGGSADELFIGLDAAAGDGWDGGLDEDADAGATVAFAGPAGHPSLRYDVRAPAALVRWRVAVPAAGGRSGPVTLSWDRTGTPPGKSIWWVRLDDVGAPVADSFLDAAVAASLLATPGTWVLSLSDSPPLSVALRRGWNLMSLPVEPASGAVSAVLGQRAAGGVAWAWGANRDRGGMRAWSPVLEVSCGQGIAVFAPEAGRALIVGVAPVVNAVVLHPGWNLIGVAEPCLLPGDTRLGPRAYLWQPDTQPAAFAAVDILLPWNAYWVYWIGPTAETLELPALSP
jgi:hypothetical protein